MRRISLRVQVFLGLTLFALTPLLLLAAVGGPGALSERLGLMVTILLAMAAAGWVLSGVLTHRLDTLLAGVRRFQEGDWEKRIFLPGGDPLWEAAGAVNTLVDQLQRLTEHMDAEVARRTATLERKAGQLRAVGEVGRQVAAVLETDVLLRTVTSVVRGTFGYDVVAVLLGRGSELEVVALAVRAGVTAAPGARLPLAGAAPVAEAFRRRVVVMDGVSPLVRQLGARSEVAVPITLGERLLGVLTAQSKRPAAFDDEDRFTLETLAGQVAVALENGRLLSAERQLREMAVVEERNRMAREIHDTLAQGFMGILLQVRAAGQVLDSPEELKFHLAQAEELANRNLQEARRSVWNLRPRPLEGRTLAEALSEEVAAAGRRAALDARFSASGSPVELPPAVDVACLRIVQEALANAIKHSRATQVAVDVRYCADGVQVAVTDNGVGFDPGALPGARESGGFGLGAMNERARGAGGSVEIASRPGVGTTVTIWFPTMGVE